jgi:hypothetical protein
MPRSDRTKAARFHLWRRWAALALAAAAVGLPINHLFGYALLVVAAVVIFTGEVTARWQSWLAAAAVVAIAIAGEVFLGPPRIEEGHNLFRPGGPNNVLQRGLPPDVYRFMAAEYAALYPKDKGSGGGFPARTFAFSADGIFESPQYSRRVATIDFSDPVWLRLGFINEVRYNDFGDAGLERRARDRRFWMGWRRWHLLLPWFVMYQMPAEFVGSELCWRGTLLWEGDGGQFAALQQPGGACRSIQAKDAGRRIFGVAIKPGTLAMSLDPPLKVKLQRLGKSGLMLLGVLAALALLVRWRPRRTILPFMLIGASLLVIAIDDLSFIGGWRPFDGGDDGLVYEGWGRLIAQHLLHGNIMQALRGQESVFYFGGPGLRYFVALERFLFGDTHLGYLALILLFPMVCFALFRRFLPERWALVLIVSFILVPVGALFGSAFFHYSAWAARGFAGPAAAVFFVCGLLPLLGATDAGPSTRLAPACGGALLFALAVCVRPNLAPMVGMLLGGAGFAALYRRQWARLAGLCIGFVPVLSMALHNWVFGGVLVPFSSNATLAQLLLMPPSAWPLALWELLRLDIHGPHLTRAGAQIVTWLSGPAKSPLLIPLHALGIIILLRVAGWGRGYDPWLRLLAGAALAQHLINLCYAIVPRYFYLTWLMTALVDVVWFKAEGRDLLRHWLPGWYERAAKLRASARLAAALDWLQRVAGDDGGAARRSAG